MEANDLVRIREALGLKPSEMAEQVGVNYHTYLNWERPDRKGKPTGLALEKLTQTIARLKGDETLAVAVDPETARKIKAAAHAQGMTESEYIGKILAAIVGVIVILLCIL